MAEQGLYKRQNGTFELRFRLDGKTVSVYGKTPEECREKRDLKLTEYCYAQTQSENKNTVLGACLQFCEDVLRSGSVHEEGYRTLMKTARFIGRSVIGGIGADQLNDDMIGLFKASVAAYADNTVKRAVYMLQRIKKEAR